MPETLIKVDLSKSAYDNDMIHNRWHPDVPIVAWVGPGDDFIIETYDWTGGVIKNNDSADDGRDIDPSIVHFLSAPSGLDSTSFLSSHWDARRRRALTHTAEAALLPRNIYETRTAAC